MIIIVCSFFINLLDSFMLKYISAFWDQLCVVCCDVPVFGYVLLTGLLVQIIHRIADSGKWISLRLTISNIIKRATLTRSVLLSLDN